MFGRVIAGGRTTRRGQRPWHVQTLFAREPGDLAFDRSACRQSTYRTQSRKTRVTNAILDAVEARFTALEMQIKTVELRAKPFQFAREKEELGTIVDLPNPLKPRRLDS